jgi:amidase
LSDIGGSIRNPSHYNGVYEHKPFWGIVPTRGHIPGPPGALVPVDIGVAGPLARGVADPRTALSIMAGPLPQELLRIAEILDATAGDGFIPPPFS